MSALRSAVGAEWTKLWTLRTVWWALLAGGLLMGLGAAQYALFVNHGDYPQEGALVLNSPGGVAVLSVDLAQFALIALAMLLITGEYSSGTIRATLAWIPSRGRLMLAKGAVVAAVAGAAGVLLALVGAGSGALVLESPQTAGTVGDVFAIGAYMAAISVLALGLGATLRGPVVTLVALFLLIVVVPPLLQLPDNGFLNGVADALPGMAGMHFLRGDADPYPAVAGLLILLAWAVAALLAGWRVMSRRDA